MATPICYSRRALLATASMLLMSSCATPVSGGVYVAGLDTREPSLIGSPAGSPVWSPDGQDLIWSTEQGIQTWKSATDAREQLTADVVAGLPAYAPQGDQIAYFHAPESELILFNPRTRSVELRLDARAPGTTAPLAQMLSLGGPSWSPEGRQLAFTCWDGAGDEICVLNVLNGLVTQLTKLSEELSGRTAAGGRQNATSNMGPPAWSPDGASIAVAAYPERRGGASGLFVIDVAKGSARRLSDLQPNSKITWEADSGAVLFSAPSPDRSDVFRVDAEGRSQSVLTASRSDSARNPALLASGDIAAASSDGAIVVIRNQQEVERIYVEGLHADYPAAHPEREEFSFVAEPDLIPNYRAS